MFFFFIQLVLALLMYLGRGNSVSANFNVVANLNSKQLKINSQPITPWTVQCLRNLRCKFLTVLSSQKIFQIPFSEYRPSNYVPAMYEMKQVYDYFFKTTMFHHFFNNQLSKKTLLSGI